MSLRMTVTLTNNVGADDDVDNDDVDASSTVSTARLGTCPTDFEVGS